MHVKGLSSNYVLTLLDKYPTPEKIARARLDSLVKIPHLDRETADTLQAAAKNSLGSNQGDIAEHLVRQKVRELRSQQEQSKQLDKLIENAWNALPEGPFRRLLTIKGIGPQTAAALVAKIVSIDRFQTATALIGYFGIFPEEVDVSGTDRQGNPKQGREIRMSRKGNDLVRRLLYTAAQCAVTWNPPVKALFARQMADGKEYNVAIGHGMAKLLRQVFALWKKDEDFDPGFESPEESGEQSAVESAVDSAVAGGVEEETAAGLKAVEPPEEEVTPAASRITSRSNITPAVAENKLPPLNYARLREMVSITQILEHVNWQPRVRRGDQWRGGCLLHEEADAKSEAFAVETKKSVYCCHRCGGQGNVLDLWIALSGKPILAAGWDLVATFGLQPPLLGE